MFTFLKVSFLHRKFSKKKGTMQVYARRHKICRRKCDGKEKESYNTPKRLLLRVPFVVSE